MFAIRWIPPVLAAGVAWPDSFVVGRLSEVPLMWLFPSYWDEGTALADLPVVAPIVFPKYPQNAAEHLPLQIFFSAGFWLNAQRKQPKDIGWLRYTNVSCEVSGFLVHRVYGICTYGIHSFALCGFSHAEIADTFIPCSMQWP